MASSLPLPKYHRVYLVLREQLHDGRFQAGLPGEITLMQQFGVARVTVRRALQQLAEEGLIFREPGRGTRPTGSGAQAAAAAGETAMRTRLTGLLENLVSMGLRTSVKVLTADTLPATAPVAAALQLRAGDMVQKAQRIRSTSAGPLSHITTYVPVDVVRPFGRRELTRKPILLLMEEQGVAIGRAEQSISACLADAAVAGHLQLAIGSAVLAVRRLIYDEQDRPVQWLHGLYRPDRYEYEMKLSRVGSIDAKVWVSSELSAYFH